MDDEKFLIEVNRKQADLISEALGLGHSLSIAMFDRIWRYLPTPGGFTSNDPPEYRKKVDRCWKLIEKADKAIADALRSGLSRPPDKLARGEEMAAICATMNQFFFDDDWYGELGILHDLMIKQINDGKLGPVKISKVTEEHTNSLVIGKGSESPFLNALEALESIDLDDLSPEEKKELIHSCQSVIIALLDD